MFQLIVDISGVIGAVVGLLGLFWTGRRAAQLITHHHHYHNYSASLDEAPTERQLNWEPPRSTGLEPRRLPPARKPRVSLFGCLLVLLGAPLSLCLLCYALAVYLLTSEPPPIVPIEPQTATVGRQIVLLAKVDDPTVRGLTWSVVESRHLPSGASIDSETGKFAWTPEPNDRGRIFYFEIEAKWDTWLQRKIGQAARRRVQVNVE